LAPRASRSKSKTSVGGLPPSKADGLFQPFEQHGTDRTGLGLGLAISRQAVAADGGSIRVRNLPGKGGVFAIDLPAPAAERQPPPASG
jgi:signal transduction histidine kinase